MGEPTHSIALFDTSLSFGGFQRDTFNLAIGFAALGHRVEIVLACSPQQECIWELPESVRIVQLDINRAIEALFPLSRYLRASRPDVLISTSTESSLAALAAVWWAGTGTRVVARETAIWSIQGDVRLRGKMVRFLAKRWYPKISDIVAISTDVKTDLIQSAGLPENLVRVIYNPAVTPGLLQKCLEPVAHPWFQPGPVPIVLSAGRLHSHKDFPSLLAAFKLVREKRQARLVILGEGEERTALEALSQQLGIREDFDLPGFAVNPSSYMSRAAVFVLSSPAESFGNVLAEAMACGTPLVATDCPGGPPEIMDYGRYGRLVPVGNIQAMAQAILDTLDRPIQPEVLREGSKRFFCDRIAAQYLTLPAFSGMS